jgi:hypothetical protein
LSDQEAGELASRFRFSKVGLPELSGPARKTVRAVHPSLRHIAGQVSFVGAAVALADLDSDGLPNDLIYVDPRTDQVIVAPAPGTRDRYPPFDLNLAPQLPFRSSTMAPMGCLVGDFNEDGRSDILVYYWGRSPVLFLQVANPATQIADALTRERFVPRELVEPYQVWYTSAATQADLDGDGHTDLIVGNYYRDGARILDAEATSREQMPDSAAQAYNGGRSRLFLWQGAGDGAKSFVRFREAEGILDDEVANGWNLAVGAADLDGDLLPEIYLVQDFGPDRLLHNRSQPGKPRFTLLHGERTIFTPRSKVLGRDSFNGMGVDFGDMNGDGVLDIFVSNITCRFGLQESHFLFLSEGPEQVSRMRTYDVAPYRDASEDLSLSRSGWGWDAKLVDFDNDGVLEVIQAAGYLKGAVNRWPELQEVALVNDRLVSDPRVWHRFGPGDDVAGSDHNPFFVRARDGRYHDLAPRLGLDEPMVSRGIATADVDGDGLLDFAVANQWGPSFFFHNTAPAAGDFLGLHLRQPIDSRTTGVTTFLRGHPKEGLRSRPAFGAVAAVHLSDGRKLVAQVDGGNGHSGKRSPDLLFGLSRVDKSGPVPVDLRWRGGDGRIHSQTLRLPLGWHTVILGETPGGAEGSKP